MDRRRQLLGALASMLAPAIMGCTERIVEGSNEDTEAVDTEAADTTPTDEADNGTVESADGTALDALTTTATELAGTIFTDQAYERARQRFSEQTRRLFQPAYFERLDLGATAIGGPFKAVDGRDSRSTAGTPTVTLDLSFRESSGQLAVSGGPDALTRARLDGEYRRPAYVDRDAFESRERTLRTDGCELPAAVALPNSGEQVPGAVIVHGDGNIDREFATGGTAMYRDLAEGLASSGVATLRYDKRTVACELRPSTTTLDREVTHDALTAIEQLRAVEDVRSDHIVVLGHSLGGMAAPRIATLDGDLAGIIGLGTPARPLERIAVSQTEYLVELLGHDEMLEPKLPAIRSAADRVAAGEFESDERILGRTGSFWDSLRSYDHLATAAELSIPQHYVQGGRDFQIDPAADFEQLQSRLSSSTATLRRYPTANHRCMPTNGPSVATEYRMPNNVLATVITDLSEWIERLFYR